MEQVIIADCEFESSISLSNSEFQNNTYFLYNDFKNGINLHGAKTSKNALFKIDNCKLGFSMFFNTAIKDMEITNCKWNKSYIIAEEQFDLQIGVSFGQVYLPNTYINNLIAKLPNIFSFRDFIINVFFYKEYKRQEKMQQNNGHTYVTASGWSNSKMAVDVYRKLRLKFTEQGEPEIAGEFYFREKVNQRRGEKRFPRILQYFFQERLFGYGERPWRFAFNGLLVISIFTFIYSFSNDLYNNSKITNDLLSSFYFSIVTFTTLGYGDYHPENCLRFVASLESLIGALLMALFVVTLTRKYIR